MKIAIMGFGIVGSGVAEVITQNADILTKNSGKRIEIKYILDIRTFEDSPFSDKIINDFNIILNDNEISTVAEVMGGVNPAYEYVLALLKKGKNVVTSNKELVATKGAELLDVAKKNNVNFLFEASVGGGIPVIRPINQCLSANKINSITGILNGTTNYILTKMIEDNISFETALSNAQSLGYAEKDPKADISGADSCRKISILASLAFGKHIYPNFTHTQGIEEITLEDAFCAEKEGYKIKLLGTAKSDENDKLTILVAPFLVPLECPLSSVNDVYNAIIINGNYVENVMFYGRGAGKLPTASAVVADIIDCAKHINARRWVGWNDSDCSHILDYKLQPTQYFLRFTKQNNTSLLEYLNSTIEYSKITQTEEEIIIITKAYTEIEIESKLEPASSNLISKIRVLDI